MGTQVAMQSGERCPRYRASSASRSSGLRAWLSWRGSDRILGAHLVGPGVDEVINLFGLAIRHDLTAEALKATMFAYPTGASDIGSML